MSWNPHSISPGEAALELPDHMISALVAMVLIDHNPEDLARVVLESVSAAVGLEIQIGDENPVKQYRQFAESALGTLRSGGQQPEYREALLKIAAKHCREVAKIGKGWADAQTGFKKRLLGGGGGQKYAMLDGIAWPLVNL